MNKTLALLKRGFQSSSGTTPDFLDFVKIFKKEFTKELVSIGATNIQIGRGHFYVSGFFTVGNKPYYFSLSDVRSYNPNGGHFSDLLYRTAKDYKDYTGGINHYVKIESGMCLKMNLK